MKHLTIHAGLNAYPPDSTAKQVIDADLKAGYQNASWHYIIDRKGNVTQGRNPRQSCVRSELLLSRVTISVLLLGGWDDKEGPVSDFTEKQREAFSKLYFELANQHLTFWTVKVHSPVPTKQEINQWLYPNSSRK